MARTEITGRNPRSTSTAGRRSYFPEQPQTPPACFTVKTFCAAHDLSESFYFKLKNQGLGPREMRVGSRVLITFEAAAAWRAEREAASSTAAE
jgi:hypothetical protein